MRRAYLIYAIIAACASWASAQDALPVTIPDSLAINNIVDVINNSDGCIYVYQPQELYAIVSREQDPKFSGEITTNSETASNRSGFRIQVFSDNNIRTAKTNAENRKRLIQQQMPELRAYLSFESPYWRVRVGDFRSHAEADATMRELKSIFPAYADDFRVVRDRVHADQ